MYRSFVQDVYARTVTTPRGASSPRSYVHPDPIVRPVRPVASSTPRLIVRGCGPANHVGTWPTVHVSGVTLSGAGGCVCDCHGNGDASGLSCDVERM